MHDKMDPSEWEQAVKQLKQARLNDIQFSDENRSVFHVLKFSYDNLKSNTLRQCFLHCSLWPEDYVIHKDDLIKLWMGLGLIDEPRIQEAYDVGYYYIETLQGICLLEICDGAIQMHDVIRDMALWIANNQGEDVKKWIVQAGAQTRELHYEIDVPADTEILSLTKICAYKVSISIKCSSTKLSILLLNNSLIDDSTILRLELFPKLTFLDLSSNELESFPIEICKLVHLRFLNLSDNLRLNSLLPEELGALTNLKYMFLQDTECIFPNKVISNMKALRVLDLRCNSMDESLDNFLGLQEDIQCLPDFVALGFSFSNSSTHDFQEFSQKVSLPIRWLKLWNCDGKCLSFTSFFLENSHLQSNLISIDISYMNSVKSVKFEGRKKSPNACYLGELETLSFDYMWDMKEVMWKRLNPKDVFPKLQFLTFWNCPKLTSISWVVYLPCIQELYVGRCDNMKKLIRIHKLKKCGVEVSQQLFPFLKTLSVENNGKLERISDPIITFPALEFLTVYYCKLKKLPFKSSNIPRKLKSIRGNEEWWNNVKMEDGANKSSLQPFFKKLW
ncbi:Disease resistance protein RPS5 [Rhynchospora pubera]|uniref:Disease resistance protein RPS5 n=1 Tax=Rhynchospora pubera TaxID=906938 RepID=A0AAV8CPM0_9POAL|nr:Disease resistance protein RPS5 [Rhynchospora pubera]